LNKIFRIRERRDFVKISQVSFYFRADSIMVQCGFNNLDIYRAGFTASKKVGNAVVRNRCKRRMRAVADMVLNEAGLAGVDYVFIAKKSTFDANWSDLVDKATFAINFLNNKISKCKKF
jgi:ribonuclease P protein component